MTGELTLRGEVTAVSTVCIPFKNITNVLLHIKVIASCLIKQLLYDTAKAQTISS